MRKIISQKEKNRKKRTTQYIVGGVLIFIMLFSSLGYSFMGGSQIEEQTEKINYNGFEFVKQNGLWILYNEDSSFVFRYNPKEVKNSGRIDYGLKTIENYVNKPLYFSSENREAESEIYGNLQSYIQRVQYACTENEENCSESLPVKTCDDNFIIIKNSNVSEITQDKNCVFIYGDSEESLIKLSDEFLFKILKIEQ